MNDCKTAESGPAKVAILSPIKLAALSPHGGITPVVLGLSRYFLSKGISVDLLVFRQGRIGETSGVIPEEVRVRMLDARHKWGQVRRLIHYLKQHRPDGLIAAGHRANLLASWAKKASGSPARVVVTIHNIQSREVRHPWLPWNRLKSIERFYRWADGIVAVSEGVAADITGHTRLTADDIRVIHNPIVGLDSDEAGDSDSGHPWFRGGGPPVILGAGRLTEQKGFDTLIRAFAQVRRTRPARLVILGKGKLREDLISLAGSLGVGEDVDLPGFVDNPRSYMAGADVFVLSSGWEGFGNVLVEAMAAGTPVVATDCRSGPREILDDGAYGPLVPVADPSAMASAIVQMLEAPPAADRLKSGAARFSIEKAGRAYSRLLFPETAAFHDP